MGQAKQNKLRLGKWYGKPIVPGHPDFVLPKKQESVATETTKEEPMHSEVVRTSTDVDGTQEGPTPTEQVPSANVQHTRPHKRRVAGSLLAAMFGVVASSGIDLGPEPEYRRKKR